METCAAEGRFTSESYLELIPAGAEELRHVSTLVYSLGLQSRGLALSGGAGGKSAYQPFTASLTTAANLRISSSVVSKEHIQRTIDSSSIQV